MAKTSSIELFTQLHGAVERGELLPVYFLWGGERLLIDRLLGAIRDKALEGSVAEFNHDVIVGGDAKAERVVPMARTVPMMGERRLVEIRDAGALKAEQLEVYLPYLQDPSPSTVMVFVAQKVDSRLKFFRRVSKLGYLFRFDPVSGRALLSFVRSEAKRLGSQLEAGAADLIVELVGSDLLGLSAAVEKLSLYAAGTDEIRVEDVERVVTVTRQSVIFELTDAVGERRTSFALEKLHDLLESGEPEQRILVMIARQIRLIWSALQAGRLSGPALASELGVPPFIARRIADQARQFSPESIRRAHEAIYRADVAIKTTRIPRPIILEKLVLDLCTGRPTHYTLRPPPNR